MKKPASFYQRAQLAYERALGTADRVIERTFVRPLQHVWTVEMSKLTHGMGQVLRSAQENSPLVLARAQAWLHRGLLHTARTMGEALSKSAGETLASGYSATADAVRYVQKMATPLDDLVTRARITSMRQREVERLRQESMRGMVGDVNATLVDRMRRVVMRGGTVGNLVETVAEMTEAQAWRIERLVRTETSYAYNLAQSDAIMALSLEPEFRGVMQRWTERVTDGGKPMDNRVGKDSIQMHGQVARPGGAFSAPGDWHVPGSWTHPPNRPNDRSVLTPWLRTWGVPAWMWQAGRRIEL